MRVFQVQAQVSCTTSDGWGSSRQVPTMWIGAEDGMKAARMVSDMAWIMSGAEYGRANDRRTYALVCEVDTDPMNPFWVGVAYRYGGIETMDADTYAALKKLMERE